MANVGPCETKERRPHLKSTKRRQFNDSFATYLSPPDKNNRTAGVLFLLGYDVFKRHFKCYNVAKLRSTRKEEADLDALFDPLSLSAYWKHSTLIDDYSLPDQLLNPCRPGSRSGINFKCANPILPSSNARNHPNNNGNTKIPYRLVQIFKFYKQTANASALLLSAKEGAEPPSQIDYIIINLITSLINCIHGMDQAVVSPSNSRLAMWRDIYCSYYPLWIQFCRLKIKLRII